jgi:hypothetical protein
MIFNDIIVFQRPIALIYHLYTFTSFLYATLFTITPLHKIKVNHWKGVIVNKVVFKTKVNVYEWLNDICILSRVSVTIDGVCIGRN